MTILKAQTPEVLQNTLQDWRTQGLRVGFVPTMGALHEGHLSLVRLALQNSDRVVASVFVNPTQFAPHEDFDRYPRQETQDTAMLEQAGAHLVWLPAVADLYPHGPISDRKAGAPAQGLETDFRPHFFDGVVSVVWRLFDTVKPDIAVFGEKDFQQLKVIEDMVARENMPIRIIPGPIVRDKYGLALSSRNAYLSPEELAVARQLNKVLFEVASSLRGASSGLAMTIDQATQKLLHIGFSEIQYLEPRWNRLLAAVKLGSVRLIDNAPL
ncbi:MAG: pantoate--beta-alanine ligase [Alphaproteobacteria bacterium]|nr:pantoate--beta-alanine ligase [Alphaproteobacteria bacterium]